MASDSTENPYRASREVAADATGPARGRPKTGSLLVIFLTVFIDLLGFGMVLPLLPIYAKTFFLDAQTKQTATVEPGATAKSAAATPPATPSRNVSADAESGAIIGLLMASFSAMQFIFAPVWGRLSDRIGRRPVLMIGLAGSVAFYTLFGLATVWENLFLLFVARIGAGIAGATIPTAQAYIADTTTLETRSKGMALIGAAFGLGFALGPLLGSVAVTFDEQPAAVSVNSTRSPAIAIPAPTGEKPSPGPGYVAAGLSALALALAFFLLPESLQPDSTSAARRLFDFGALADAIKMPSIGPLLLTLFICILAFANFETTFSMLISGKAPHSPFNFNSRHVLYTFAYIGLVLSLAQGLLVRRLSGKVPEATMAGAGAVLEIIGFSGMIYAVTTGEVWQLLVAVTIVVCGFAMMMPSLSSLISRRSDPKKQGGILGLSQSVSALARIIGPLIGLPLLNIWLMLPYCVASGMMAIGLLMIVTSVRGGHDFAPAGSQPALEPLEF